MNNNNNQREGASSNTKVGRDFEKKAKTYFKDKCDIDLTCSFSLELGLGDKKKPRRFDLGLDDPKIIVECKNHTWTKTDKVPTAKMTNWNLEMYYFHLAPQDYRKIFFCLKHYSKKRQKTLAEYYIEKNSHLIPHGVEIWEYCEKTGNVFKHNLSNGKQITNN